MSAKDTANRIFHFIAGLVLTLLGIILVIMQFSEKWSFTIFPFLILLFDLGWIGVAFEKHKKAQKQVQGGPPSIEAQNNPPPVQAENNPQIIQTKNTPPPLNKS